MSLGQSDRFEQYGLGRTLGSISEHVGRLGRPSRGEAAARLVGVVEPTS